MNGFLPPKRKFFQKTVRESFLTGCQTGAQIHDLIFICKLRVKHFRMNKNRLLYIHTGFDNFLKVVKSWRNLTINSHFIFTIITSFLNLSSKIYTDSLRYSQIRTSNEIMINIPAKICLMPYFIRICFQSLFFSCIIPIRH